MSETFTDEAAQEQARRILEVEMPAIEAQYLGWPAAREARRNTAEIERVRHNRELLDQEVNPAFARAKDRQDYSDVRSMHIGREMFVEPKNEQFVQLSDEKGVSGWLDLSYDEQQEGGKSTRLLRREVYLLPYGKFLVFDHTGGDEQAGGHTRPYIRTWENIARLPQTQFDELIRNVQAIASGTFEPQPEA